MTVKINGKDLSMEEKEFMMKKTVKNFVNVGLILFITYLLSFKVMPFLAYLISKLIVSTVMLLIGSN